MDFGFIGHPLAGTPIGATLDLSIVLGAVVWLLSVVTRNYSWIDRVWSICPALFCLIVAASLDFEAPRVNLMAALVVLWGARLTFNLARKGGFRLGDEDYRWTATKERLGPLRFQLLNATFVAPAQMVILWLFVSPVHQAWLRPEAPLNWLDWLAAALFLALLVIETVADEQMWAFQAGQEAAHRGRRGDCPTVPDNRPVQLFAPSELCQRDWHVVGVLPVCRRGLRGMGALVGAGVHFPHRC